MSELMQALFQQQIQMQERFLEKFLKSQNDKENALKYLNKAYEISGDDYYKERIESLNKK